MLKLQVQRRGIKTMKKRILGIIFVLAIGYTLGAFTTTTANANTNYVIASVEWVLSKISPIESKVAQLEQRVANLENDNGGTAPQPVEYNHVTTTTSTAVRRSASSTGIVFFTAPTGTVLMYDSTYTNSTTGEKWYIVKLSDGKLATVLASHTTPSAQSNTTINKIVVTKATSIKRGAASTYENIYSATTGMVLAYSSTYTNSVTGEKWYIVKTPTGKYGAMLATNGEVVK